VKPYRGLDDGADLGPDRGGDDWNPAERCREMVAHSRLDGAAITHEVAPAADLSSVNSETVL
jgi:hypothetical protein